MAGRSLEATLSELEMVDSWVPPTPWDISKIKPAIHFYSKISGSPIIVRYEEDSSPQAMLEALTGAGFLDRINTRKVIFITHGFENDVDTPWLPQMKDEILKWEEEEEGVLVGLLGWGCGAEISVLKYTQSAANIQSVATWFIGYLKAFRGFNQELYIWGIGHSLGAHLLGLAGRGSGAFDRLTALDPAGPSFEKVNQEHRLCKGDGKHVDVIHTDGYDSYYDPQDWFAPVNHYGTLIPLGHIDFYPNFGYKQPGISHFKIAESHHRAIELFLWSIPNPRRFITNTILDGVPGFEAPIDSVKYVAERVEMGYHSERHNGIFYIKTNPSVPWVEEEQLTAPSGWSAWSTISSCNIS